MRFVYAGLVLIAFAGIATVVKAWSGGGDAVDPFIAVVGAAVGMAVVAAWSWRRPFSGRRSSESPDRRRTVSDPPTAG